MTHIDLASVAHASRAVMTYDMDDRPTRLGKLMTASLPAMGILVACAVMLLAIV